jgi:hypothetical protein
VLEVQTRQAAIDLLLERLQVSPGAARVDPTRTVVQVGASLWTIVAVSDAARAAASESPSLRRAGAKHKRVR